MPIINTALTLKDLPPPPPGKTGWPWTEQTEPLPKYMPNGSEWSRISIITPSYNQEQFIEETIRSVLLQGYPNLEYIIIDGGSTDKSVEIIKKYEPHLAYWVSKPDRGQSNALNEGFHIATGEWIGWQNSDDYYCQDAFKSLIQACLSSETSSVIYAGFNLVEADGSLIESIKEKFDCEKMLPYPCMSNQGILMSSLLFKEGNFLDESLHYMMDYEFFWRLYLKGYIFNFVPIIGGCFRRHSNAKTSGLNPAAAKEFFEFYKKLYEDNRLSPKVKRKVLSCMIGSCLNDFGRVRLKLFRKHVRDVVLLCGLNSLTFEISLKYLISFIDERIIGLLKSVKSEIIDDRKS